LLSLALGIPFLAFALLMGFMVLVMFNGCFGAQSPAADIVVIGWLFGLSPLAALGAALAPAVQLGRGRGRKSAWLAFGAGAAIAAVVYAAGVILVYVLTC
jgi:hypothetical protein